MNWSVLVVIGYFIMAIVMIGVFSSMLKLTNGDGILLGLLWPITIICAIAMGFVIGLISLGEKIGELLSDKFDI